jgi:hypothetical protein
MTNDTERTHLRIKATVILEAAELWSRSEYDIKI